MPATTKVPLGASTTNRKWYLDVDTATPPAVASYIGVFGIQEFKDTIEGNTVEDSDFDGNGWQSEVVTANKGGIEIKVGRKVTAAASTAYDPGQEKLRLTARKTGVGNRVRVRYYEMETNGPRVEAYEGFVTVSYTSDGGDMKAASTATIKLTFQGEPLLITHPAP